MPSALKVTLETGELIWHCHRDTDRKTKVWDFLLQTVHITSGTLPVSYSMDTRAPFPKVKELKREVSLGTRGAIPLLPPLPSWHENN